LLVTAASEEVCWDFGDKTKSSVKKLKSPVAQKVEKQDTIQEPEVDSERIYCNLVELAQDPIYENQR
jgi:hypothetical protein